MVTSENMRLNCVNVCPHEGNLVKDPDQMWSFIMRAQCILEVLAIVSNRPSFPLSYLAVSSTYIFHYKQGWHNYK